MAFKNSSQKKKKKSKKKSPADREWSHEGGQQLDATTGSDINKTKTGRRRTQERDERQRRGRSKIEMRKEKQAFARKMSQKVSFNQILGLDEKENEEPETTKKRRIEPNPMKSTSQVYKKIKRFFVDPSLHSAESGSDIEEGEEDLEEPESGDEYSVGDAVMVRAGVILKDIGEFDDSAEIVPPSGVSDWFFSSNDEDNSPSDKPLPIKVNDLELSPTLTTSISGKIHPKISPFSITKVGDIPDLHTMWGHLYRNEFSSPIQSTLLSYLSCYADMFIEGRDEHNDEDIENGALWHILGHIVNSRISVMKHDKYLKKQKAIEKLEVKSNLSKDKKNLKKKKEKEEESTDPLAEKDATAAADGGDEDDDVVIDGGIELNIDDLSNKEEVNVQDSGYTRPRVLILCPFRSTALEIVTSMKDIFNVSNGATGQGSHEVERTTIKNWEKFQNEYSLGDEEAPPDNQHKPSDWQSIFKDNLDDEFKMGIQVNPLSGKGNGKAKGVHMRLFTDFYHSDIILASPLGLRLILENSASSSSSSSSVNETKRGVESDYLSSLEIIYFHQADILLMQNWSHVEYILQHCNQLPQNKSSSSSSLSIDFTRIRPYFLDNLSKQHRQIIISSNFHDPIFNSLMRQECQSKAGIIKLKKNPFNGCLSSILTQVKQIFNIIPTTSFLNEEQERFQYFTSNVLTPLLRLKQSHTLIVTPSYLHFVQVRNELIRREANAAFISEYSRESEISRGRSQFFHGTKEILLYSGRAHFFRRFRLRGARHLIFYSLPEYAHFYPEIVNFLGTKNANEESSSSSENQITSCIVLCTRYEKMALERIVGAKRCEHMMSSGKTTFMFF